MFPELSTIKLISTGQRRAAQLESFAEEIGMPVQIIHLGEITYPLLSPEFHELSQHISDYIQAPTIAFHEKINHLQRRAFSAQLKTYCPIIFDWYESNRLRYNNIIALSYLPFIYDDSLEFYPVIQSMLDDVIRVMPQSAEIYEQLTLIERIEVTQNIAFHLKNLYVVLQQQEIVQTSII